MQGVNYNIPQMFQIAPCLTSELSWKCDENLFICFPVMLLRDMEFFEKNEKKPLYPKVTHNIPKMLQIVPGTDRY